MSETDKAVAKAIESAGKVAPELWADIVSAAQVEAIMAIVTLTALAIVLAVTARRMLDLAHKVRADKSYSDGEGWFVISTICAVVAVLIFFAATCWVDDAIYPQASAVRSMVGNQCNQ